jgi:hypothetical protein
VFASYGSLFHSHEITNHVHNHGHEISLEDHILISTACHNAIYHDIDEDCGHSEHFSQKEFKPFIDVEFALQKAYIAEVEHSVIPKEYYASPTDKIYSGYSNTFFNLKSSRGPPVL